MSKAQDDFLGLQALAKRLGLEDKEEESFISSSMARLGHKARQVWEDGGDDGGDGGDFFSRKPKAKTDDKGKRSSAPWGYADE